MTIASAFNDIAVAQGGTADNSGTITGAIDALNDALAGNDQERADTIESAVKMLGDHIGGGGPSITVESLTVTENDTYTAPEGKAYSPVVVNVTVGGNPVSIQVFKNNAILTTSYIYLHLGETLLAGAGYGNIYSAAGLHAIVVDENLEGTESASIRIDAGVPTSVTVKYFEYYESYGVEFDLPLTMEAWQTMIVNFA